MGNATARVDAEDTEDPDVLFAGINVLPAHRRKCLGTRLLAELVALARSLDKTVIVGATPLDPNHPRLIETPWELPVETAQRWLDRRGVLPPAGS